MMITQTQLMDMLAIVLYRFMNETEVDSTKLGLMNQGVSVLDTYEQFRVDNGRGSTFTAGQIMS